MRKLIAVSLIVCAGVLSGAGSASAAPAVNGIFDLPEQANRLALGPDGNIWVTLGSTNPDIARVSPDGTVTPFTTGQFSTAPVGITAGPDGNMWVTGTNYVGKFPPNNPAAAVQTPVVAIGAANGIVVGQDGNLWTGSQDKIFRITPTAVPIVSPFPTNVAGFTAKETASASDGRVWLSNSDNNNPGVLPFTLAGAAGTQVNVTAPGSLSAVGAGPNGQIAYANPNAVPQQIGLINNGVAATPFSFPAPADPNGVLFGQDGSYWIGESNPSAIGRYSTTGVYTKFADMPANSFPRKLVQGTNGTIWVILERPGELFSRIARISGVEPPDQTAKLTNLTVSPNKFKVGKSSTALIAKKKKTPTGTTFKFTLDKPATVFLDIRQKLAGKKSGTKCKKPTKKLRKKKNCTRTVSKGTLRRLGVTGANSVKFSGRLNKTKLKPGKYEVWVTAFTTADGPSSAVQKKSFTVVSK